VTALAPVPLVKEIAEVLLADIREVGPVVALARPVRPEVIPTRVETVVVAHLARYQALGSMPVVVAEEEKHVD
jgi:hypothetical protein